ncbi:CAAX amino terminal protease self- immunity [Botrimarina colliarenosi]|uniref:CAAX amino terminal protease self-immunity n=1 Tax=Botrimarina colliarenosi TaxID=2528001 RepID=A0A5C6A8D6_9BACT|nr:CPBP family intramembrane glutamic endopeptidase [Botrimarina colliarenosi]TWT95809.1 CAAX amino terminal protease self- immunity [Botrimarina colliarenosi]
MPPGTPPPWLSTLAFAVLGLMVVALWTFGGRLLHGLPAVEPRRRRPVPWGGEGALLAGFYLVCAALSLAASVNDEAAPTGDLRLSGAVLQLLSQLAFAAIAVAVLIARYPTRGLTWGDLGLGDLPRKLAGDVGLGVLACMAMLPFVYGANYVLVLLFGNPTLHPAIESLLHDSDWESLLSIGLVASVGAPLFEELAFRVLLQGGLERIGGRRATWPIVASSLAFALAHTNQGYAPVPIAVLALGLGYVYRQTHSYPAVVAMHVTFNSLSLAVVVGQGQLVPAP